VPDVDPKLFEPGAFRIVPKGEQLSLPKVAVVPSSNGGIPFFPDFLEDLATGIRRGGQQLESMGAAMGEVF